MAQQKEQNDRVIEEATSATLGGCYVSFTPRGLYETCFWSQSFRFNKFPRSMRTGLFFIRSVPKISSWVSDLFSQVIEIRVEITGSVFWDKTPEDIAKMYILLFYQN